ncbi:lipoprotein N-acyltransferase Lnb domain-containing protein [Flavobacterium sp.]|uniref:lipoprotein N-acyltransferase Lnb domain-containing protein n=1 Tax=Flavobacterium sp. TaxID=239 RepID=UPI002FD979FA
MTKYVLYLFILGLSCISYKSYSQNYPLSYESQISILTCGSGTELHAIFGHTAIRIADPVRGLDIVYNFGMFDFRTPNFYLKFVKGDLQYFVANTSYENFIYAYTLENRSVYEQKLELTQTQKQNLFDKLNKILFSDDKFYTYKFIHTNCTTKVVDLINSEFPEPLVFKTNPKDLSYRKVLNPFMEDLFYEKLGINILFGYLTDHDATQLFLPIELMNTLDKTTIQGKKIAQPMQKIFEKDANLDKKSLWNTPYTFLLILLGIVLVNKRIVNTIFLSLMGVLGLVLIGVGFYSNHIEVTQNYNILLFNPLLLGALYFYKNSNPTALKRWKILLAISMGIYFVFLLNKAHFWLMLPIGATIGFMVLKWEQRK